jgi:hypothetical protein
MVADARGTGCLSKNISRMESTFDLYRTIQMAIGYELRTEYALLKELPPALVDLLTQMDRQPTQQHKLLHVHRLQIERIAALSVLLGSALIALFVYLKYPSVQKW